MTHPSAPRRMAEREFQVEMETALRSMGYLVVSTRFSDLGRVTTLGWPDIFAVHPRTGEAIAWELKVGRGRATPAQLEWIHALAMRCASAAVIYPDQAKGALEHAAKLAGLRRPPR